MSRRARAALTALLIAGCEPALACDEHLGWATPAGPPPLPTATPEGPRPAPPRATPTATPTPAPVPYARTAVVARVLPVPARELVLRTAERVQLEGVRSCARAETVLEGVDYLREQVNDKTVSLDVRPGRDGVRATLAYVQLGARDIGAELLRKGLVVTDPAVLHPRRGEYEQVERGAIAAKRGCHK